MPRSRTSTGWSRNISFEIYFLSYKIREITPHAPFAKFDRLVAQRILRNLILIIPNKRCYLSYPDRKLRLVGRAMISSEFNPYFVIQQEFLPHAPPANFGRLVGRSVLDNPIRTELNERSHLPRPSRGFRPCWSRDNSREIYFL